MFEPKYLNREQIDAIFQRALQEAEASALVHYMNSKLDLNEEHRPEHKQAAAAMHANIRDLEDRWQRLRQRRERADEPA